MGIVPHTSDDAPPLAPTRPARLARPGVELWGPFVAVMIVLGALAVAPLVTTARVNRLRAPLTEAAEPALVLVNDLEASLAAELYASTTPGDAMRDRGRAAALAEARDLETLGPLARRIGDPATADLTIAAAAVRRWHARTHEPLGPAHDPVRDDTLGLAALDATQRMETDVERFAESRRATLRASSRLETWTVVSLVPLAILGVVVLAWTSWRTARLATVAEERRTRLADAARGRERLLRGVSHDLRNPLGAAAGFLSLLGGGDFGPLAPAQQDAARRAERLVRSALRTTGDLLDIARADAGQLAVHRTPVALDTLVREIVDDHAAAARQAGLALGTCVDGPVELHTDAERVRQVLGNLLSNAVKYTPSGGAVQVRVAWSGDAVAIEVRDTGPGVPMEYRERVFEEAVRLPGAQRVAPGAGIGLAAARRVARALGGDLAVDGAPEGGARFTLRLPAAPAAMPREIRRATVGR